MIPNTNNTLALLSNIKWYTHQNTNTPFDIYFKLKAIQRSNKSSVKYETQNSI